MGLKHREGLIFAFEAWTPEDRAKMVEMRNWLADNHNDPRGRWEIKVHKTIFFEFIFWDAPLGILFKLRYL